MSNRVHYIYIWKESGVAGSGLPFYVGQGKYQYSHGKSKYIRAYSTHLINKGKRKAYCQNKADKLAKLGTPHVVEILYDNLTIDEANELEKLLISRLGRISIGTGILTNLSEGGEVNPMNCPDIRKKQLAGVNTDSHKARMSEISKSRSLEPGWLEWNRNMMTEKMNDPEYYKHWYAKFTSEENIEKLRSTHGGTKIVHNGIEYRSIRELARVLGISSQLLRFRIKNNIPFDLVPSKANRKGKDF